MVTVIVYPVSGNYFHHLTDLYYVGYGTPVLKRSSVITWQTCMLFASKVGYPEQVVMACHQSVSDHKKRWINLVTLITLSLSLIPSAALGQRRNGMNIPAVKKTALCTALHHWRSPTFIHTHFYSTMSLTERASGNFLSSVWFIIKVATKQPNMADLKMYKIYEHFYM